MLVDSCTILYLDYPLFFYLEIIIPYTTGHMSVRNCYSYFIKITSFIEY